MKKILLIIGFFYCVCYYVLGQEDTIALNEIVVSSSYKAVRTTPFSFKNLDESSIELAGRTLEPANLLQHTPSVSFNTDNGLFTGYTYYRLRGIDQTRINVSLNGVPMNEPEDQGIYFNNFPNFLQTIKGAQVIRGAGVSKSGISSYGGSIDFETYKNTKTSFEISYGSYNTLNVSANANLKKGWIRASVLNSDGYKYHSGNKSMSVFYGVNPIKNVSLIGFVGKQKNQMAWIGSPLDSITKDHRYNANKESETDEFLYIHNQLHYNVKKFNVVLFHTYLNGWYNMDMGHFDGSFEQAFYKLSLSSNWFGTNTNYEIFKNTFVGVSAFTYKRNHDNLMSYSGLSYESYNKNYGVKNEFSPYVKTTIPIKRFNVYGDVQYRVSNFCYYDKTDGFYLDVETYHFLNWSVGTSYFLTNNLNIYWGIGKTHREPTRTDLFGGNDNYYEDSFSDVSPEEVLDFEIGTKYNSKNLFVSANVYYMDFKNEIVLNGQVGPNAIVIHSNVAKSKRIGLESDLKYSMFGFVLGNVTNVSNNKITQDSTEITHVLSPSLISSTYILYQSKIFCPGFNLRYNGESYIDLTNDNKIPSYLTVDFFVSIIFDRFGIEMRVNNVFNKLYYSYGNIGFDGNPAYFQQAETNYLLTLKYNL